MTDAALQCAAIGVYERNSLWNEIIDRYGNEAGIRLSRKAENHGSC